MKESVLALPPDQYQRYRLVADLLRCLRRGGPPLRVLEDLQLLLRVMSTFEPGDYLDAQCLRAGLRRDVATLLRDVDVLALPTTLRAAPKVTDAEVRDGMTDTAEIASACRYAFLGNLTGLPAGTAPVGTDTRGMPLGLQIMADAWDEATVLQVLAQLERTGVARVPKPHADAALLG